MLCWIASLPRIDRDSYNLLAKCASFEEEETDHILVEVDDIVESQPRPMPEILGAGISPMYDAAEGTTGMAPGEG